MVPIIVSQLDNVKVLYTVSNDGTAYKTRIQLNSLHPQITLCGRVKSNLFCIQIKFKNPFGIIKLLGVIWLKNKLFKDYNTRIYKREKTQICH